ncbi:MAG: hypothetical protein HZC41_00445 [Chloroflexi bacterium]|nr:hypothetical protein [Chloroflexota bacterium]
MDTWEELNRLSNERFNLYLQAGHGHLTIDQQMRLDYINARLPVLWDLYRRELAAQKYPRDTPVLRRAA